MCGIAGFQGAFRQELLHAMSSRLSHRGPDGAGAIMLPGSPPTGFAHRRLAILDLTPQGAQPMTVACPCCGSSGHQDLSITYNGELYNYRELREALEGRGHRFHSRTDTEVVLHLYAEHGTRMLDKMNGIFAFALFDGRSRRGPDAIDQNEVLLVRDPLGVKPVYYSETPEGLIFASELKAVMCSDSVARDLDLIALHQHLAYLWAPAPRSMFAGVRKLPPGTALRIGSGRVRREWSYYDQPYPSEPDGRSENELLEELRERLRTAVQRQLVSDVPVGAFLSGGVDSSAIAALARAAGASNLPCYTARFDQHDRDGTPEDYPYARMVADHLGVELRPVHIEPDSWRGLQDLFYQLDEPQGDPAPLNALRIAQSARADGVPVLLSGAGGDDIFSGYRRHRALRFHGMLRHVPPTLRRVVAARARTLSEHGGAGAQNAVVRRALKWLSHVDRSGDDAIISHFLWSTEATRRALYSRHVAHELAGEETARPLLDSLARIPHVRDPLNRMLYLETRHFLADHNLAYTDRTSMASGVEARVPLLDLDLVEFAVRLPPRLKQNGGVGKYLFREAVAPMLPPAILSRAKTGFSAPIRTWVRVDLREWIGEALSDEAIRSRGLFDPRAVRKLIDLNSAGRIDASYTIFQLLSFELWCRSFVDGHGTHPDVTAPAVPLAPAASPCKPGSAAVAAANL